MSKNRRSEIIAGLFILLAMVAFGAFAFAVGGLDRLEMFRARSVEFRTRFDTIQNLALGAKVTVGGRKVGSVLGFEWTERPYTSPPIADPADPTAPVPREGDLRPVVEVRFVLEDPGLRLDPDTASIALHQDGILGQFALLLDPGHWRPDERPPTLFEREWTEGERFVRSTEATNLDDILASTRVLMTDTGQLIRRLDDALRGGSDGRNLARSILENTRNITTQIGNLLDPERPDGLRRGLIDPTASLIENADGAIREMRDAFNGDLLNRATTALDTAQRILSNTDQLLVTSRPRIETVLAELEGGVGDLRSALADGRALMRENRAGIAESVRRMRRAMWEAEMALRKIRANPAYILFGDDDPDLQARPVDLTGPRATGRAEPYLQRDEGDRR